MLVLKAFLLVTFWRYCSLHVLLGLSFQQYLAFLFRIEQELLARIVSEMNQPVPDPTALTRPQATPESSTVSEPEDEDADVLGELKNWM